MYYGDPITDAEAENALAEARRLRIRYHVGTGVLPSDVIGDRAAPCGCGTSLNDDRMTAAKMQARNVELRKQASGR